MILYVSCVSLAIAFSASDAAAVSSVVLYSSSNSVPSGFVDKEREKRTILGSAAARGLKALEKLLRKTRPVKDEKRFYKYARFGDEYEKTGSFLSALNDFDSVYPKGVKEYILPKGNILKVGKVGDRTLYLKKHGVFGQPTLEILQNIGSSLLIIGEEHGIHCIPWSPRIISEMMTQICYRNNYGITNCCSWYLDRKKSL